MSTSELLVELVEILCQTGGKTSDATNFILAHKDNTEFYNHAHGLVRTYLHHHPSYSVVYPFTPYSD